MQNPVGQLKTGSKTGKCHIQRQNIQLSVVGAKFPELLAVPGDETGVARRITLPRVLRIILIIPLIHPEIGVKPVNMRIIQPDAKSGPAPGIDQFPGNIPPERRLHDAVF